MSYGVPNDNTDATKRAGRLAPSLNALADAVDNESSERLALRARLDTAEPKIVTLENKVGTLEEKDTVTQSQLDSAVNPVKSKNTSQDSHLKRIDKKIETIQAALVAGDKDLPPGTTLVPPLPVPSPDYPDLPPLQNPVLGPDGWQEGGGLDIQYIPSDLLNGELLVGIDGAKRLVFQGDGVKGEDVGGDVFRATIEGGGGGAVAATVLSYTPATGTGTARWSVKGTVTTGPFINGLRESPGPNDVIALALNINKDGTPFAVGSISRAGGYYPPVLGPFTNSVDFPIGSDLMSYKPIYTSSSMIARDYKNILNLGDDSVLYGFGTSAAAINQVGAFRPATGLSSVLPPIPESTGTLRIIEGVHNGIVVGTSLGYFYRWDLASSSWVELVKPTNAYAPSIYLKSFFEDGKLIVFRYANNSTLSGLQIWKMTIDASGITEEAFGSPVTLSGTYSSATYVKHLKYEYGHAWLFITSSTAENASASTMTALHKSQAGDWFRAVNQGGFSSTAFGATYSVGTWGMSSTYGSFLNDGSGIDSAGNFWTAGEDNKSTLTGKRYDNNYLTRISPQGVRSSFNWFSSSTGLAAQRILFVLPVNGTVTVGGLLRQQVGSVYEYRSAVWRTDGITTTVSFISDEVLASSSNDSVYTTENNGALYGRIAPEGGSRIMFVYSGLNSISYMHDVTF